MYDGDGWMWNHGWSGGRLGWAVRYPRSERDEDGRPRAGTDTLRPEDVVAERNARGEIDDEYRRHVALGREQR